MCDAHPTDSAERPDADPLAATASRRTLLKSAVLAGGTAAVAGAMTRFGTTPAQAGNKDISGDRIVMLGVDGGPVVNPGLAKPAIALVVNDVVYLVDCGLDTARQLVQSGLGFAAVRHAFITHHHFDHTSGLPDLLLHGWVTRPGLATLDLWGPPDMAAKVDGIEARTFAQDIGLFTTGGGFPPFPPVTAHDVTVAAAASPVMEDENVTVEATRVFHGAEVPNAYAYRFTVKRTGKVVVFSGDTAAPDQNLIGLAQGCDVLVHECQDNDRVDELAAGLPAAQGAALRQHLYEAHSNVRDLPAVAKAAGAEKLVFCHYTPTPQPPAVYLRKARDAARSIGYRGEIVAPSDLDVIRL
ncbi:MBL fold metallo-hydrolase [Modestobacter altitudinis]|uniref:MBL fold metallo-hydrolase n=1 Tax=Modestobacter altitudinis TaxID=2213158 RepID=UPI001FE553E6|nr:MBL fold metallo-hydrolase [Modestobacter altitudinis]